VSANAGERAEIAQLVSDACSTELMQRLAAARGIGKEQPFAFSLRAGEPLVTGVLDVVVRDRDGGCLIVDYKSDRVEAEDLELLTESVYGAQRLVYALAALYDGAREVEVVHWFLQRPSEWVGASYTVADRAALEQELITRAEHARARGFHVSPVPHRGLCLGCPGRGTLCSWSEDATLREQPEVT
jgi:hypothetical protein